MHCASRLTFLVLGLVLAIPAPGRADDSCVTGWPCPHIARPIDPTPVVMHIDTGYRVGAWTASLEYGHPVDCHGTGGQNYRSVELYLGQVIGSCALSYGSCLGGCSPQLAALIQAALPRCLGSEGSSLDGVTNVHWNLMAEVEIEVSYGAFDPGVAAELILRIGGNGWLVEKIAAVDPLLGHHVFVIHDGELPPGCYAVELTLQESVSCQPDVRYRLGETENYWFLYDSVLDWDRYNPSGCPFD